jgi:hypothetical protein
VRVITRFRAGFRVLELVQFKLGIGLMLGLG